MTSLEDLPDIEQTEEFDDEEFEVQNFVPENRDNSIKKKVRFDDEVYYEPEKQITMIETFFSKIKSPFLVFVIVFLSIQPMVKNTVMTIPFLKSYGSISHSVGIATISSIIYFLMYEYVL